ncbi:hypothetical protein [Alicyclobacillus fodiniaquatilis]|uniref:Cellulose biosynthesis protein BcsQ n=1 Tax=Alicyclobacillus fodiniaquatilis TaxID=1661150 RepID=A0ABW4JEK5_9BACL
MLILLIRKEVIYNRIIQNIDSSNIAPYMADLSTFQTWIADNSKPTAVLLEPQWPRVQEAKQLLGRLNVPVEEFTGQFAQAEAWLKKYSSNKTETLVATGKESSRPEVVEQVVQPVEEKNDDSMSHESPFSRKVMELHDNPLLKRRRSVPMSEIVQRKEAKSLLQDEVLSAPMQIPESIDESQPVVEEAPQPQVEQRIIERIIEREIEKPVYIREEVPTTLSPVFVIVVGLWPRAGTSLVSMCLAELLTCHLPDSSVALIEHPRQQPRMFDYFAFTETYTHWLENGRGTTLQRNGIELSPMKPGLDGAVDDERVVEYVYQQLRRPFTILDAGNNHEPSLLYELANHIVVVIDCDPTLLNIEGAAKAYHALVESYSEKLHVVLNKWTRFTDFRDQQSGEHLFPKAIPIPYLDPATVQEALWKGTFFAKKCEEDLRMLSSKLVMQWLPHDLRRKNRSQKSGILGRFKRK